MDSCPDTPPGEILVCGLGGLGQACLASLVGFDLPIRCLDQSPPVWADSDLGQRLESVLVLGDMRHPKVLLQAGVSQARAVLLLSQDSGVNLEAALQVRLLNPRAQLVVRSSANGSSQLERQLQARLPGLAIMDPQLLTAGVFANALRPDGTEAAFELEGDLFVVRSSLQQGPASHDLFDLLSRRQRLVQWLPAGAGPHGPPASGWWDLDGRPGPGDRLLWLELASTLETNPRSRRQRLAAGWSRLRFLGESWGEWLQSLFHRRNPSLFWGLGGFVLLVALGSHWFGAGSPLRGLMLTLALIKGEYLDAFSFILPAASPQLGPANFPLAALSLLYALGGTLLTAWLVALILDRLLAARIGRQEPRPLPARTPYVLLLEGERLAERLEQQLRLQKFQVVRVQGISPDGDPEAVAFRSRDRALRALRHCPCQAVGVLSNDLMANLAIALELQERWPGVRLAVQSHSLSETSNLNVLFEGMQVINPLEVAADAVVATALGERVRGVLRLAAANLLLTEYQVETADSLHGLSLAAVAGGYGLIPLVLIGKGDPKSIALPNPERVLQQGDRLVVLGSLAALRQVENGSLLPPRWTLELTGCRSNTPLFEAQWALARFLGAPPGEMGAYLNTSEGPQRTPPLYQAPGRLLEKALNRLGVDCDLVSLDTKHP